MSLNGTRRAWLREGLASHCHITGSETLWQEGVSTISELLLSTLTSQPSGLSLKELSRIFIRCYLNLNIVKLTYFTAP